MAWFPVTQWLIRCGFSVIRVKGQRVKALRRYLSEHAKSDVIDSHVLGSIPAFGRKGLDGLFLPSARQQALNRLTRQRFRYQTQIAATKTRLLDLIRWAQPALEQALFKSMTTVSLAVLKRYFNPFRVQRVGAKRLASFIRKNVAGTHPVQGEFADQLAERLIEAARATIDLYGRDTVDFDRLQLEVRQEIALLEFHRGQIRKLDQEIESLYAELHPDDNLRTIPGIGELLGPSLLGGLHSWRRFGGQRRLRGYCGLFPRRKESGGVEHPAQRITKGGSNRLKRDLTIAADAARKVDPSLARVYYSMMVDKGKHHRQAICAVATRLLNRIHAVLKEGRPYILRDLDGNPISIAEAKAIIEERFQVPESVRLSRRRSVVSLAATT